MDSAKQLKELSKVYMEAVYGGGQKKDTSMVVTNADKKANTKAYQNLKAGVKGYKAADHMEEGKKADKDYDGDGKIESGKDEYFGSKDKAIKKAMGKELKDLQKAATTLKGKNVAKADVVTGVGYKEETILEKQKDTPKQVAAVIDFYRSKKGTGEAVKDTEEGDTKDAKKERDYAAFERSKMKKDDPNWKHKKGSTSESVESDEYIETVQKVKAAETQADIKRWGALKESGKFTVEELESMAWDIYEADTYAAQLARFEAGRQKRMKASGSYERPKWIPKDQDHSDDYGSSKGRKTTKENYQAMRNPEKEEKKDTRSAREKRMADPKKGINSPAFKEFMRQQGM